MKLRNTAVITTLTAISIGVSLLLIYIVLTNHFIPGFNLSSQAAANIGTVIGGVTAPVFTLLSAILVYMAFVKQTESNDSQRLKNDIDIVFLLFNQIEAEIRDLEFRGLKGEELYHGQEAFDKICALYNSRNKLNEKFGAKNHSSAILYIIDSYKSLQKVISASNIESKHLDILREKSVNFYILKLRDPLRNLCFEIRDNTDSPSLGVLSFFNEIEKTFDSNFNLRLFEKKEQLFEPKR